MTQSNMVRVNSLSFFRRKHLRVRETITSHFRIPSSSHLEPIFTRKILNVGFATPAVLLPQIDSIWAKSGREFLEVILSRALRPVWKASLSHENGFRSNIASQIRE